MIIQPINIQLSYTATPTQQILQQRPDIYDQMWMMSCCEQQLQVSNY